MTPETQAKVVDYIKLSAAVCDFFLKKASAEVKQAEDAKALIPAVVDSMIKNQRLDEAWRKEAESQLLDHSKALEILKNTAAHRNTEEQMHIGTSANGHTKQASVNDHGFDYLGHRSPPERESDRIWFERMGIK